MRFMRSSVDLIFSHQSIAFILRTVFHSYQILLNDRTKQKSEVRRFTP